MTAQRTDESCAWLGKPPTGLSFNSQSKSEVMNCVCADDAQRGGKRAIHGCTDEAKRGGEHATGQPSTVLSLAHWNCVRSIHGVSWGQLRPTALAFGSGMNERNRQRFASRLALLHLALPQPTRGTAAPPEADRMPVICPATHRQTTRLGQM